MTKKGETFIYSSIFCVKYNFFCEDHKKIKREIKKKNKKRNKKEKGSEFPECYRQNIYRTI